MKIQRCVRSSHPRIRGHYRNLITLQLINLIAIVTVIYSTCILYNCICHFALEMKINNKSAWYSLEQPWLLMATANRSWSHDWGTILIGWELHVVRWGCTSEQHNFYMPYLANKPIAYKFSLHANIRVPCAFFCSFFFTSCSWTLEEIIQHTDFRGGLSIRRLIAGTAASRSFHGGGGLVYSRLAAAAMAHGSDV